MLEGKYYGFAYSAQAGSSGSTFNFIAGTVKGEDYAMYNWGVPPLTKYTDYILGSNSKVITNTDSEVTVALKTSVVKDDTDTHINTKDKHEDNSQPTTGDVRGWTAIEQVIGNTAKGDEIKIKMNNEKELPKEVLSQIIEKNVDAIVDMAGYSWTIKGKDITSTRKDIDLRIKSNDNLIDSAKIKTLAV